MMVLVCGPAFGVKYLVTGNYNNPSNEGLIVELAGDGVSIASTMATPAGGTRSHHPAYNSGNGLMLFGGSHPGPIGVYDFQDYIDNGTTTVSNWAYGGGMGLVDDYAADPNSGKFLTSERGGHSTASTIDPTTGAWTYGASHTEGIPETTWIYNNTVYMIGESGNCWSTPLLGDGTTAGAMTNIFNTAGTVGIPHSQGGYSEWVTCVSASDGTTYLANLGPTVYEFDLNNPAGGVTGSVNVTGVFTNADRVHGIQLDEAAGRLYIAGQENAGVDDFIGVIDVSTWTVTKILREVDGDTVVTSTAGGLAFVDLGGDGVIPEPAGLGLVGIALLGLRKRRS